MAVGIGGRVAVSEGTLGGSVATTADPQLLSKILIRITNIPNFLVIVIFSPLAGLLFPINLILEQKDYILPKSALNIFFHMVKGITNEFFIFHIWHEFNFS